MQVKPLFKYCSAMVLFRTSCSASVETSILRAQQNPIDASCQLRDRQEISLRKPDSAATVAAALAKAGIATPGRAPASSVAPGIASPKAGRMPRPHSLPLGHVNDLDVRGSSVLALASPNRPTTRRARSEKLGSPFLCPRPNSTVETAVKRFHRLQSPGSGV